MKNKKKVLTTLMGVLLVVTLIPLIGYAAVPQQITYQGQLTDQYGDPVPDGDYLLSFALYDVSTGGTSLWAEAQTVAVTDGIYNVILGQPGNELDPNDFYGDLYLGVTVGTDAEMTPRQPVTAVGYALRAAVADSVAEGAVTETMIVDGAVTTAKVADNAITESKLGDATVTTVKIQDGATLSEISDDDGAGSGLDADLFDGQDSSAFMPAGADNWVDEAGDTMTGQLQIQVASVVGLSSMTSSSSGRAIYGYATASTGTNYGVWARSNSTGGYGVSGIAPTYGVYGSASAPSGSTSGVRGESGSTSGRGVSGHATASTGTNYGVRGESASTSGSGVSGYASASSGTNYGVRGESGSTSGHGVSGYASASSGTNYGVYGRSASTSGRGVSGYAPAPSGTNYGVRGESSSTSGSGVSGYASATSGTNYGVRGESDSAGGYGVSGTAPTCGAYGLATATSGETYGVWGQSDSTTGRGVFGTAPTYGVYGSATASSGTNYGVYAHSASGGGYGVYGYASASSGTNYGVYGRSNTTTGRGVFGLAPTFGVYGLASAASGYTHGVLGQSESTSGSGVSGRATASSGTNYGVYGYSFSTSGYDFYAAGSGTNYGPFTGAHEVKLTGEFPEEVAPGMIVAVTGEAQIRNNNDGSINLSSTLPTVKLADRANDKAVLGVLVAEVSLPEDHWYEGKEGERFATVNALGEGRVWVTDSNGTLEAGDYITTSAIPGYGQKQDDDLLHSYTLGKAIETVTWDTVTETVEFNGKTYKVYLIAVVYTSG